MADDGTRGKRIFHISSGDTENKVTRSFGVPPSVTLRNIGSDMKDKSGYRSQRNAAHGATENARIAAVKAASTVREWPWGGCVERLRRRFVNDRQHQYRSNNLCGDHHAHFRSGPELGHTDPYGYSLDLWEIATSEHSRSGDSVCRRAETVFQRSL